MYREETYIQNSMVPNHTRKSKSDKITICFDLNTSLALRLRQQSSQNKKIQDALLNSIISSYFTDIDNEQSRNDERDFRKYIRKEISIPAVIELKLTTNETQYKPVHIFNISNGGLGIRMEEKSARVLENINKQIPFMIMFCIPTPEQIVQILCRPVHVTLNAVTEIGASFLKLPEAIKNTLCQEFGI
jgi:PilZ domain